MVTRFFTAVIEKRLGKSQYQHRKEQQTRSQKILVPDLALLPAIQLYVLQETGMRKKNGLILAQVEQVYQHRYRQRHTRNQEKGI